MVHRVEQVLIVIEHHWSIHSGHIAVVLLLHGVTCTHTHILAGLARNNTLPTHVLNTHVLSLIVR